LHTAKAKVEAALQTTGPSADLKALAMEIMLVPERTLVGRIISSEPLLGRSLVDDLEKPDPQTVEPRTIIHSSLISLTVSGTTYVLQ